MTGNCLRAFGFTEDKDGVRAALLAGKAFVVYDAGGYSDLMTGEEALRRWEVLTRTSAEASTSILRCLVSPWLRPNAMTAPSSLTQFPPTADASPATSSFLKDCLS
ncbi:MAG: hypothetical protein ACLRW2_00920 [Parasutterella excrementihominis]